jgi:hypothetical protein
VWTVVGNVVGISTGVGRSSRVRLYSVTPQIDQE